MRVALGLLVWGMLFACANEGRLCSEDPDCRPASNCGPSGCLGGEHVGKGGSGGDDDPGGGGDGGGGAGGGGTIPTACETMCRHVYLQCGTVLAGDNGEVLAWEGCLEHCATGAIGLGRATCVASVPCFTWQESCLAPVAAEACDAVCSQVYGSCGGALAIEGRLVDAAACPAACSRHVTPRQANCILGSACEDWLLCTP